MQEKKKTESIIIISRAAAVFFAVALLLAGPASASVSVRGTPEWIRPTISGPMGAVWDEIKGTGDPRQNRQMLEIVIERLFPGIRIMEIGIAGEDLILDLSFDDPPPGGWLVRVEQPDLIPELRALFADDIGDAADILREMIAPLPLESIAWAGQAFQSSAGSLLGERVPGWFPSLIFMQAPNGSLEVAVSFQALPPVVVAYSPRISSRTLPRVLQSEVVDNALEVLSPFIGLPGAWVSHHEDRIEEMVASALERRWASRDIKGKVTVGITPERIAPVDIKVESGRYTLQAWAAIHMGSDERYPEIGIHLGRRTAPLRGWDLELYGEWVARTNDLSVESRWGARWSAWPDIWVGFELAYPGENLWYRVWLEEILPRVYLWGRVNSEGDAVAGIGWRFGGYLAWELYYDNSDEDRISVRLVGNL